MTNDDEMAKRWKLWLPRFSVRTLAIFVTVVCAYFGAWELTKRFAVSDQRAYTSDGRTVEPFPSGEISIAEGEVTAVVEGIRTPVPFIMIQDEILYDLTHRPAGVAYAATGNEVAISGRCLYYVWIFGLKMKLPFQLQRHVPLRD